MEIPFPCLLGRTEKNYEKTLSTEPVFQRNWNPAHVCISLLSHVCYMPLYFISLHLIIPIIYDEDNRLWNSSLLFPFKPIFNSI
jgi:hypothetical protein